MMLNQNAPMAMARMPGEISGCAATSGWEARDTGDNY